MERSHENLSDAFESAVKIILQWDSTDIFEGDRHEIDQYLQAVDEIRGSMELMSEEDRSKAKSVIQIAIARLEDEFVSILTCPSSPRYSSSSSSLTDSSCYDEEDYYYLDYNPPSNEAIYHLRSIVETMNSVRHLRQCVQVYIKVRKALMEVRFRRLRIEKLSIDVARRWETEELEAMIKRWIRAAKVCVRVLFAIEKQLCDQIFQGFKIAIDDACFLETVRDSAIQLFTFAEAISNCPSQSPEILFNVLKLYRTLSDHLPDVEVLFQSKSSEFIRIQADEILGRLSEVATEILWKFEDAVLGELSELPAPGGTIHSLTVTVMKYIIQISIYKQTLDELIVSKPSMDLRYSNDLTIPDEFGEQTPLALHLIRIVVILQFKLEVKSKQYNDVALSHLFMMNNVHYIVRKIEGCPELKKMMIGGDFLKQLTGIFRQAAINYQRSTWVKVLYCLNVEGLYVSRNLFFTFRVYVLRVALKERLKSFNALFEEVQQTQARWSVPDLQLREELRILISQKLIPGYRNFIVRHYNDIPDRYVRYTSDELETAVLGFFEGNPAFWHLIEN